MAADILSRSGLSRLGLVGLGHRTAPPALRDRIAAEEAMAAVWADRFAAISAETLVLVTCDRVEALLVADDPAVALDRVAGDFAAAAGLDRLADRAYRMVGVEAVRHLFRVASSLDSLVVGEPHVLGQVKDADRRARAAGRIGPVLDLALSGAYGAAKRVRTETAIGERPVSIAAAAGHVARDIHGDLSGTAALMVGTAEMGELLIGALASAGLRRCLVADTGGPRPAALARRLTADIVPFERPEAALATADIVICAAGRSDGWSIAAETVRAALRLRRRRPLFLVDAALPAGIDPTVQDLDGAFLYSLGDLERLALDGRAMRAGAVAAAEAIVDEELALLIERIGSRDAGPAIRDLAQRFEQERLRALADAGGDAERATGLLVARLMHGPATELRRLAGNDPLALAAAEKLLVRMFEAARPVEATKEEGGS